jgi:hypothetical protein
MEEYNRQLSKNEFLFLSGAMLVLFVSRVPFWSEYLWNWDAVQLALALERYDIASHQPHPPGYIVYVMIARILSFTGLTPHATYLTLSLLFSAGTLIITYLLARRISGIYGAITAVVILIVHPFFWFYGIVGESYAAEGFVSVITAYACWQMISGRNGYSIISAVCLGIGGGIRQNILLFMMPLYLFSLIKCRCSWRQRIMSILVLIISVLAWLVPATIMTGGLDAYMGLSRALFIHDIALYSIFAPSYIGALVTQNFIDALWWNGMALGLPFILAVVIRLFSKNSEKSSDTLSVPGKWIFLAVWIIPPELFYFAFFVAKEGYLLSILPGFSAGISAIFARNAEYLRQRIRLGKILLWGTVSVMIFSTHVWLFLTPPQWIMQHTRAYASSISGKETLLNEFFKSIHHLKEMSGRSPAIIFNHTIEDFRIFMYYLTDTDVYILYDHEMIPPETGAGVDACVSRNHQIICSMGKWPYFWGEKRARRIPDKIKIPIRPDTLQIVWFTAPFEHRALQFENDILGQLEIKKIITPAGLTLYYSDIHGKFPLQASRFIFVQGDPEAITPLFDNP